MTSSIKDVKAEDEFVSDVQNENAHLRNMEMQPYGPSGIHSSSILGNMTDMVTGFKGIFSSRYVVLCAAFSAIGGMLFGYEYVPQFHSQRTTTDKCIKPGCNFSHFGDATISAAIPRSD